jgi:hypothetical protein
MLLVIEPIGKIENFYWSKMVLNPLATKKLLPDKLCHIHRSIEWIDIPLKAIKNYSAPNSKKLTIKLEEYALRFVDGEVSEEAYRILELCHPIYVIPLSRGRWECLMGHRTSIIAKLVLGPEALVTVGVLPKKMDTNEKTRLSHADQLLTPLIHSLRNPPETLIRLLTDYDLNQSEVSSWLPNIVQNATGLASALGRSRATIARATRKLMAGDNPDG